MKTKLEEAEWFAWHHGTDPGVVVEAIRDAVREARAEAFEQAMHHIYCRMGARSTPLEIISALKELAAKDPE